MNGIVILAVLILMASPSYGKTICDWYSTYHTYCNRGYSCCYNNQYCCQNDVVVYQVTNEASLNGGVIAAIVMSSVVLFILLVIIAKYTYTRCKKKSRAVHGEAEAWSTVNAIQVPVYMAQPDKGQDYSGGSYMGQANGGLSHGHVEEASMPPQYHGLTDRSQYI